MPAGSAVAAGHRISLHNDPPVTPEEPLRNISVAVTREAPSGRILAPQERLTVEQGIRAQTIDAACCFATTSSDRWRWANTPTSGAICRPPRRAAARTERRPASPCDVPDRGPGARITGERVTGERARVALNHCSDFTFTRCSWMMTH
jgi:Amidohydrolase family